MNATPETPLGRALRRIAKKTRLSSLDVPVLDDAAAEIDELQAKVTKLRDELKEATHSVEPASYNEATTGIPQLDAELFKCASSNGRIRYEYLCSLFSRGYDAGYTAGRDEVRRPT